MKTLTGLFLSAVLVAGLLLGGGCSRNDKEVDPRLTEETAPVNPEQDQEEELRKVVRRQLEIAARESTEERMEVQRMHPYWYRAYSEYPEGTEAFTVRLQETESRTTPYKGEVTLPKVRYATKFHNDRSDAQADSDLIRHTGEETLAFELRHGRWALLGSTFIAEKSEQNVNGTWVPVKTEEQPTFPEEENEGWFKRVWGNVTGR